MQGLQKSVAAAIAIVAVAGTGLGQAQAAQPSAAQRQAALAFVHQLDAASHVCAGDLRLLIRDRGFPEQTTSQIQSDAARAAAVCGQAVTTLAASSVPAVLRGYAVPAQFKAQLSTAIVSERAAAQAVLQFTGGNHREAMLHYADLTRLLATASRAYSASSALAWAVVQ